jgi:hypothetical protein
VPVRLTHTVQIAEQFRFRLCAAISDDSGAHLEIRDNLSCSGAVVAIHGNAIPGILSAC